MDCVVCAVVETELEAVEETELEAVEVSEVVVEAVVEKLELAVDVIEVESVELFVVEALELWVEVFELVELVDVELVELELVAVVCPTGFGGVIGVPSPSPGPFTVPLKGSHQPEHRVVSQDASPSLPQSIPVMTTYWKEST